MEDSKWKMRLDSFAKKGTSFDTEHFEDYALGTGNLNLRIKAGKSHSGRGLDDFRDDGIEQVSLVSRRIKGITKDLRLPHIAFAVKIESVLMDIWRLKIAWDFLYPVNEMIVRGYYEKITNPICLSDIREKTARCQYATVRAFLDDLQLMMHNAIKFNGRESLIAKNAEAIYKFALDAVEHERKLLGADKDTLAILEDAIIDKFDYLNRSLPGRKVDSPLRPTNVSLPGLQGANPPSRTSEAIVATLFDKKTYQTMSKDGTQQQKGASLADEDSSSGEEEVLEEG